MSAAPGARAWERARLVEEDAGLAIPVLVHGPWAATMPWLAQGTTWRGPTGTFDLRWTGADDGARARWVTVREAFGFAAIVGSGQVHGTRVHDHRTPLEGLVRVEPADGHVTSVPGLLLAVTVADCIPVSVVDPGRRVVALLHAGWRGLAGGVIEAGLDALARGYGSRARDLRAHLGPAICGGCYVVGPEVHADLGLEAPPGPATVDLRVLAADRLRRSGVPDGGVTVSDLCPRCWPEGLFSHRAGAPGRQIALLGVRPVAGES